MSSQQQQPMDIDPVDGGPKATPPPPPPGGNAKHNNTNSVVPMQISEEEEARQAIDMFRGDDMSARVAAANRLEAVASVLGEQRTREVCLFLFAFGNFLFQSLQDALEPTYRQKMVFPGAFPTCIRRNATGRVQSFSLICHDVSSFFCNFFISFFSPHCDSWTNQLT